MQDHLKAFYADRAELAYTIEHVPGSRIVWNLERYDALQDDIEHLQADWAGQTLRWCSICGSHERFLVPGTLLCGVCTEMTTQGEITAPLPLLPWCSMCGRNDREVLPGQGLCSVCVGNLGTGAITPGEHAEALQGQEGTVGLPYCRMCKRNDRGIWSLEHMLCKICVQLIVP